MKVFAALDLIAFIPILAAAIILACAVYSAVAMVYGIILLPLGIYFGPRWWWATLCDGMSE